MTSIPSHLARVPTLLTSQVLLANITRTSQSLLQTQIDLSSGRKLNRPSDDPAGMTLVQMLKQSIVARDQRSTNMGLANSYMNVADHALDEMTGVVLDARDIASQMIGIGGDAATRAQQAEVVDAMIREMVDLANTHNGRIYLFGGKQTGTAPIVPTLGGYQYTGTKVGGMTLDIGGGDPIEVTLSANQVLGATSKRVEGDRDLNPALSVDTRISDLNGARGLGVQLGTMNIDVPTVGTTTVDLTNAQSIGDVIDLIDAAIGQLEIDTGQTILGPGRVGISAGGDALSLDVAVGLSVDFSDQGAQGVAADLGLTAGSFTNASPDGLDLDPRVTMLTNLSDLSGLGPLNDFVINNAGQTRTVDMSGVITVQDLANAISRTGIGARLEIDPSGNRVNVVSDLAGAGSMSIAETVGNSTATELGIRSYTSTTRLSDFNNGRGVSIRSGSVDPVTGLPDPTLDLDYRITLSDGTTFDVDLAGATTVQDVIDLTNAAAPPGTFNMTLADGPNGLTITDLTGGGGTFSVTSLNGSTAAEDLGILMQGNSANLTGTDRATIEVDSVLTHLANLRNALLADDTRGITIAGENLSHDLDRFAQSRAILGQRMNRISALEAREQDRQLLDQSMMSQIQDLDYNEASIRFTTLQMQLQASMAVGSQVANLSLINFLR